MAAAPSDRSEGPALPRPAEHDLARRRRARPAGAGPGADAGAAGPRRALQRVQVAGPQRPGRRGGRRRHDHPRHAQEGRRARPASPPCASRTRRSSPTSRRQGVKYSGEVVSRWLPELLGWIVPILLLVGAVVVLHAAHGRRGRHHVVRPQQGQDLRRGRRQGRLQGRRRRRRGRAGAARDRRVPEDAEEVHDARRPDSQGRAAGRPARHRQDAAGARGGRRGQGAVLQPERLGVRRDVRRRRRGAGARPVRPGRSQGAVHRLHRRARRARQGAVAEPGRQPRRARADAQPAAVRDGRLRRPQGDHHHGGDQPARGARPGAAPPRPLRSPGAGRQARRQRPRAGAEDPRPPGEARPRRRSAHGRGPHGRLRRRRPRQPGQRGGAARRARAIARR